MNRKFLILTEGSVTEPNLLAPLFEKYGFEVKKEEKINIELETKENFEFSKFEVENAKKDLVIIAQGPRNRLKELIKLYNTNVRMEKFFTTSRDIFAGIFLIYDVDQTLKDVLTDIFNKLNNEQEGLLLISSPCIEVLAHYEFFKDDEISGYHISQCYKKPLNMAVNNKYHISVDQYLVDNFEKLAVFYLDKNIKEFKNNNVMEHPELIVKKVNELNERNLISENTVELRYRYFSTVLYVCFAYILGLTKNEDNAEKIRDFLIKKNKNKEKLEKTA